MPPICALSLRSGSDGPAGLSLCADPSPTGTPPDVTPCGALRSPHTRLRRDLHAAATAAAAGSEGYRTPLRPEYYQIVVSMLISCTLQSLCRVTNRFPHRARKSSIQDEDARSRTMALPSTRSAPAYTFQML